MPGQYKIQANYYGSSQASLVGPLHGAGDRDHRLRPPDRKRQYLTLRLATTKDVVDIAT